MATVPQAYLQNAVDRGQLRDSGGKLFLFLTAVAFLSETHQTITVFLNQLQYERCGMGNAMIGYIYIAVTMIGMCGIESAWFTRKTGNRAAGIILGGTVTERRSTRSINQ